MPHTVFQTAAWNPRLKVRMIFRYLLLTLFFTGCTETHFVHFRSYTEAEKLGYIEKGWVPDCLPESSSDLALKYNLDTNEVFLRFRFKTEESNKMKSLLSESEIKNENLSIIKEKIREYCKTEFSEDMEVYHFVPKPDCKPYFKKAYMIVNWKKKDVLFWSP